MADKSSTEGGFEDHGDVEQARAIQAETAMRFCIPAQPKDLELVVSMTSVILTEGGKRLFGMSLQDFSNLVGLIGRAQKFLAAQEKLGGESKL